MKLKAITIGATLGAVIFSTSAMADLYECKLRSNGLYGGIQSAMNFSTDGDESVVFVYDALIRDVYDKPLKGTIVVANTKRITFKWSVDTVSDSESKPMPRIDYRATYLKRNHRITVTGFPAGWDNQFNGTGSCKRTK